MLGSISFRRERLAAAAADELLAATDVADLLVRRGVPFREAHGIVAGLVPPRDRARQAAVRAETARSWPSTRRCSTRSSTGCSRSGAWLESKVSEGGTSLARVREQLDARAGRAGAAR